MTPKYVSLGDILLNLVNLHATCDNILCLGGFYASFSLLKRTVSQDFLFLLVCLQYFIWVYYEHAKTVMLTFSA